jgi:dynein assembly factor with WDR repeat domains 1
MSQLVPHIFSLLLMLLTAYFSNVFFFNFNTTNMFHDYLELIEKLESNESSDFFLFKILRAHILPLTNCAFNKSGDKFITGSYDRTCKVWNTISGDELLTLEGHRNVVYAIAFNNPYGDKIITGSFGK